MTATPVFRPELFDCIQVNLALLADRLHGPGTGLGLGAALPFRPAPGPDGLPTVERGVDEHLAQAQRRLGLVLHTRRQCASAEQIRPGDGCLVVADAYHLPWVPYLRRRHMDHSFLVARGPGTGTVTVTDAYHNDTPFGPARPGSWTLSEKAWSAAVPGPALVAELGADPAGPVPGRPESDMAGAADAESYAAAFGRHPARADALLRLTLETWLLARSRALHAAFMDTAGGPGPSNEAVAAQVRAWNGLTEQAYLAYRRVERGRAEPSGLLDRLTELLHTDREVFDGAAAPAPVAPTRAPGPEELRRTVAEVAAAVLSTDPGPLLSGTPLTDIPTFSSFRVVEIVERLESELHIEFAPEDLVPENLHEIDAICRVISRPYVRGATPAPALSAEPR